MTSKKNSKNTYSVKHVQRDLADALAPCFADPPTAAAVLLVCDADGVEQYVVNLELMEAVHLLVTAGLNINNKMSPHNTPELLQ